MGERKGHRSGNLDVSLSPALYLWADHIASLSLTKAGVIPHLIGSLEGPYPSWICFPDPLFPELPFSRLMWDSNPCGSRWLSQN